MSASLYAAYGKRALDVALSALGLLILGPLLGAIALALKLADPGPVFFRQTRAGRGFKPFRIVKFRTMRSGGAGPSVTSGSDPRITPVGRFLRRTKLDELPQLFNVLVGDMSLVGPRPEVPAYVELFRDDYKVILSVKPGITDYAAILYRDEEAVLQAFGDPEEGYVSQVLPRKIELYRRYIEEASLLVDIKILLATATKILHPRYRFEPADGL